MVVICAVAVLLTTGLAFSTALAICVVALFGSLLVGTGVGLEVDGRAARRRRHAPLERVE